MTSLKQACGFCKAKEFLLVCSLFSPSFSRKNKMKSKGGQGGGKKKTRIDDRRIKTIQRSFIWSFSSTEKVTQPCKMAGAYGGTAT